ncbi:MFS family permease [Paenibacillus shirakamiensis]|uniref:MFS family permease n=1 Tax=Paenibacillus shirakamiensis TaxID=1265935 RepID=A0ABS4JI62_9BACL|nr:MFS transporter [Paenibacillus shirakamiensis]MBP2000806.1 MFS family permease [Paenibacillus shirakamiensis]
MSSAYSFNNRSISPRYQLITLLLVVIVSGMSQGLLLPLLSILLERHGVSSDVNGMNAAALYIGIFCTMFFVEKPVVRFGYKKVIIIGLLLVTGCTLLFSISESLVLWFVLRLLVGVGDSSLHFATQQWILSSSPADRRGRVFSLYGMAYGVGFSVGPLGINLLNLGDRVPFLASGALYAGILLLVLRLQSERPEQLDPQGVKENRFIRSYKLAWFALIPPLLYGVMEASMNSTFPLYGLGIALSQQWISILLVTFGVGSIVLQLPLGIWSDRIGRKKVLMICGFIGSVLFLLIPVVNEHKLLMLFLFAVAGGIVGSFYSLGMSYAADIVPKAILPATGVIASVHYSIGSVLGPVIGGYGIRFVSIHSLFYFLGAVFVVFAITGFGFKRVEKEEVGT